MGEELFGNKEFLPHKLLIQFIPEIAPVQAVRPSASTTATRT